MCFSTEDRERLERQLHRHEGAVTNSREEHVAYLDSVGVLTVGYGHNCRTAPVPGISKPGDAISSATAQELFARDLDAHIEQLRRELPWVTQLSPPRQAVLYNMGFNLGILGLLGFRTTLGLIRRGEYDLAADNMLLSKWARQVGNRARELSSQMRTGEWT